MHSLDKTKHVNCEQTQKIVEHLIRADVAQSVERRLGKIKKTSLKQLNTPKKSSNIWFVLMWLRGRAPPW